MKDITETIAHLIDTEREGDYWDFKLEPHARAGDLIKDIICLANTPRHNGDRYIIYGVDNAGAVVGLAPISRRTQADIVNTLCNAGFAGGNYPDVYLHEIELQDCQLEVLVIKDHPEKPYFLQTEYNRRGVRLHPGTVYARVRDSNTPSNQVASAHDIEQMWRQRFGLDQTPFQRFQHYLADNASWTKSSESVWHHSLFPEFTISPTDDETRPVTGGENWVRAAINPSAFVRPFKICFHQTVLDEITCIYFDEMRGITPAPKLTRMEHDNHLWFYSLTADTLEFLFLQFLTGASRNQLLQEGLSGGRVADIPVAMFGSGEEHHAFLEELESNPVRLEEWQGLIIDNGDPIISEQDKRIVAFSKAVMTRFAEWKRTHG